MPSAPAIRLTEERARGMTKALTCTSQHDQTCPVRLLRGYGCSSAAGSTEGAIWSKPYSSGSLGVANRALIRDRTVANIVKRAAALVGKAPGGVRWSHSLRDLRLLLLRRARNGAITSGPLRKQTRWHRSITSCCWHGWHRQPNSHRPSSRQRRCSSQLGAVEA